MDVPPGNQNTIFMKKQIFSASSPGFLYTVIVLALTALAAAGVQFPATPEAITGDIITGLSQSGIWAISGILLTSILFPFYNAYKKGLHWMDIWGSTATYIAFGNALFSAVLLTGIVIPPGTAEAIVGAIQMKDWGGLFTLVLTNVATPVIRWIKDRKKA